MDALIDLSEERQSVGARLRSQLQTQRQKIAFYSGHICERGTDTALFDYADGAESELRMCSYVLYDVDSAENFSGCVAKFANRFGERLIGVKGFGGVDAVLEAEGITLLYLIKIVDEPKKVSRLPNVRNLVHAVFFANNPHGDVYARISPCVPKGNMMERKTHNREVPIVPHIVRPALSLDGSTLRDELGIPHDATVFGRHGGYETFDIPFVRQSIAMLGLTTNLPTYNGHKIYFVLMNTPAFCDPMPNIIHLPRTSDPERKAAFIRTCDAMIHARQGGESFGLAIGEFSTYNKPVLTSSVHHDDHAARFHLDTLGSKGLYYHDAPSFIQAVVIFDRVKARQGDWNAYKQFEPCHVMKIFKRVFIDGAAEKAPTARSTADETESEELSERAKDVLSLCDRYDADLSSLVRLPSEAEEPHGGDAGAAYVGAFKPFAHVRYAPSTCAGVAGQVKFGEIVTVTAKRGRWLRLRVEGAKGERWMLTSHPFHGELVKPVVLAG